MSAYVPKYGPEESVNHDGLVVDARRLQSVIRTLESGESVVRGEAIAILSGGNAAAAEGGGADGRDNVFGIAAQDWDATAGDKSGLVVYIRGGFNSNAMTFNGTHTAANQEANFRTLGIDLEASIVQA